MIDDLTPWELDVARAIAILTYREAAEELGETERNVRYHAQRIMHIMGVKKKNQVAKVLMDHNLL